MESGFGEDALVRGLVDGDDVVGAEFFLGVAGAVWPISRPRSVGDPKRNRQPQDPGCRTELGAPFVEGEERRGPSTAQPNHLTGSEMGRKSWVAPVGMTGFACGGNWSWELVV